MKIGGAHQGKRIIKLLDDLGLHLGTNDLEPYLKTNDSGLLPEVDEMHHHQEDSPTTLL